MTGTERWLSGRKRPPAKWVGDLHLLSGSNPDLSAILATSRRMKTVKRSVLALLLILCAAFSAAQSLQDYLALRKKNGIKQAVQVPALETLVGTRILELQGVVKGTFQVGDKKAILLERTDGQTEVIDCETIPEWLRGGNEIAARLIVRGYRPTESASLRAVLLGAAAEDQIAPIEAEEQRRIEAAARRRRLSAGSIAPPKATKQWELPASEVTPIYAAFIKKVNRRLTNNQAFEIAQGIVGFSLKYGVDARLIMAMVMTESSFDPNTTSHAGAMGLGQLMPSNVKEMGVSNAYDTMQNLSATVRLVRGHLNDYSSKFGGQTFDSLVYTLAAYNAGPGAVRKYGGVPPYRETQNYVKKVLKLYREFCGG